MGRYLKERDPRSNRQVAERLGPDARIVTVFPGGASRYLSTIFNGGWMRAHGFLD